jgi:hypothetical protein
LQGRENTVKPVSIKKLKKRTARKSFQRHDLGEKSAALTSDQREKLENEKRLQQVRYKRGDNLISERNSKKVNHSTPRNAGENTETTESSSSDEELNDKSGEERQKEESRREEMTRSYHRGRNGRVRIPRKGRQPPKPPQKPIPQLPPRNLRSQVETLAQQPNRISTTIVIVAAMAGSDLNNHRERIEQKFERLCKPAKPLSPHYNDEQVLLMDEIYLRLNQKGFKKVIRHVRGTKMELNHQDKDAKILAIFALDERDGKVEENIAAAVSIPGQLLPDIQQYRDNFMNKQVYMDKIVELFGKESIIPTRWMGSNEWNATSENREKKAAQIRKSLTQGMVIKGGRRTWHVKRAHGTCGQTCVKVTTNQALIQEISEGIKNDRFNLVAIQPHIISMTVAEFRCYLFPMGPIGSTGIHSVVVTRPTNRRDDGCVQVEGYESVATAVKDHKLDIIVVDDLTQRLETLVERVASPYILHYPIIRVDVAILGNGTPAVNEIETNLTTRLFSETKEGTNRIQAAASSVTEWALKAWSTPKKRTSTSSMNSDNWQSMMSSTSNGNSPDSMNELPQVDETQGGTDTTQDYDWDADQAPDTKLEEKQFTNEQITPKVEDEWEKTQLVAQSAWNHPNTKSTEFYAAETFKGLLEGLHGPSLMPKGFPPELTDLIALYTAPSVAVRLTNILNRNVHAEKKEQQKKKEDEVASGKTIENKAEKEKSSQNDENRI